MTTETKPIEQRANEHYASRFDLEMRDLLQVMTDDSAAASDEAREQLEQTPLSVCLQSINVRAEECTWEILLGTGGPADRVLVTTNYAGDVEDAEYQFQDWFELWTPASEQDEELVTKFACVFYFDDILEADTLWRLVHG